MLVDANGDSSLVIIRGAYSVLQNLGVNGQAVQIILPAEGGQLSLTIKNPAFGIQALGGVARNPYGGYFGDPQTQLGGLDGQFELITLDSSTHLATFNFSGKVSRTRSGMPRDTLTICGVANQIDFVSDLSSGNVIAGVKTLGKYFTNTDSLWLKGGVEEPGERTIWLSIPHASRGMVFPSPYVSRPTGEWSTFDWDFHEKKLIRNTNPFPRDGDSIVITSLDPVTHQVSGWLTGAGQPGRRSFTAVNMSVPKY